MSRCIPIGAINRGWTVLAAFLSACMLILAVVHPVEALGAQHDEIRRVLILHSFGAISGLGDAMRQPFARSWGVCRHGNSIFRTTP